MHVELYKIVYGNYAFSAELDTGAEVGDQQLTLWYREKISVAILPLSQLSIHILLKALKEPQKTRLSQLLQELKQQQQQQLLTDITTLKQPYQNKKLPGEVKQTIRQLQAQIQTTLKHLEKNFTHQEILPLERDCFDMTVLEQESPCYGESHFLREFFFEEMNYQTICNFCQEFALNPDYRQRILAQQEPWIQRNKLFSLNLLSVVGEKALLANDGSYLRQAREFFRWLDLHIDGILTHPEYQRLSASDQTDKQQSHQQDLHMYPAIELLQHIAGIETGPSCQGITGKVQMLGYQIMPITDHREYAFVILKKISHQMHDAILNRLSFCPNITTERIPCQFTPHMLLRSTGDNSRFRMELLKLAAYLYARQQDSYGWEGKQAKDDEMVLITAWEYANQPPYQPQPNDPGSILPGRLRWLCQPERIEQTFYQLNHLNHWAKATDQLYYDDRQGLYSVKATLLEQAYRNGVIIPTGYLDGSEAFTRQLMLEAAANFAADTLFDSLSSLKRHGIEDEISNRTRQIFQAITGQALQPETNSELLSVEQVEHYIHQQLESILAQALQTRQPIDHARLTELLVHPTDLLDIPWSRTRYIGDWDTLDQGDLRKLDPEGQSLIAFEYSSADAHYQFHLPYRTTATFLPEEIITHLRQHICAHRQERGNAYGGPITVEESEKHPIEEILHLLGVRIELICPNKLERKSQRRYPATRWENNDWDDDDDDEEDDATYPDNQTRTGEDNM
ncbi:hypothetical protein [Dictyobacter arantiisoli]|uniref:Uncharacterized protein n=1 Tax=Dictyobacter arantiisoli TaxID=2014874 RepID=A0A5A5T6Y6_9CHLR|nr:hypothetical protein [Dictyobacter arantiisoli]GCF06704.1 hypothetical protein KDI_02680 [Dictyobacter arantiisoli]